MALDAQNVDLMLGELHTLAKSVRANASDIAIVMLADDANAVNQMPALKKVHFLERLANDTELNRVQTIFLENNIAYRIVFGIKEFMSQALRNELFPDSAKVKLVIDGTEGGGHRDGFGPAKRSLGALLCRQFGFYYSHGDAYSAAISRHKHHQAMLLAMAGIGVPKTWSYDSRIGWLTGKPTSGLKIICKSTYEGWSVGVSENLTGPFDATLEHAIKLLADEIGQPVCVQEFISGPEIYALVIETSVPLCIGMAEARSSTGPKRNGSYLVFNDHNRPGGIVYSGVEGLAPKACQAISDEAVSVFRLLGMSNFGRIDFRVDAFGKVYVIDIADNPGTSRASSLAYILVELGVQIEDIPLILVGLSLRRLPQFSLGAIA